MFMKAVVVFFALTISLVAFAAPTKLVVYTYSAFTSDWGPGAALRAGFEKTCSCEIQFVAVDDGASLLKRMKLEGAKSRADVALGFDSNMAAEVLESDLFASSMVKLPVNIVAPVEPSTRDVLVPFDYSWLAVMYNAEKIKVSPRDFDDLLSRKEFAKQLLVQDPRTSAPGLAFLVWLKETYGENWTQKLPALRKQVLTVSPGWTEAYGLFTKGEAAMVVSYVTSEIYHRVAEKSHRYKAAIFPSHYAITEFGAIPKTSAQKALARKFLEFLLQPSSQKILAENNWMFPALSFKDVPQLNGAFAEALVPQKTFVPSRDARLQKKLVEGWLRSFK
jgi:thiamine transport system substrate-binding protein